MSKYFLIILITLNGFQLEEVFGQKISTTLTEPVPLDKSITYGKLENGFAYYIKSLPESSGKIDLYLYVKAGSNHQDADQLNMAHFVEHMAFKTSENFPNGIRNELRLLNEIKVSPADINGTAGASQSRFRFRVSPNNPKALETGLLWFRDIVTGLHFKNEDIDAERGVMVQELVFRTADNIQDAIIKNRSRMPLNPCLQNYSNFVEHHNSFNPERLKQFYKNWYQPDRMAIAMVGNIEDVQTLEQQIANQFSDIHNNQNSSSSPNCEELYFNQLPSFAITKKPLDSIGASESVEMELLFKDKKTPKSISSLDGIVRFNTIELLIEIVNSRLRESTNVYNSFYSIRMEHTFKSSSTPSSFRVLLTSNNSKEKEALETVTRVLEEIRRYGVLSSEFTEAKENRSSYLESIDLNKSTYWLEEITNHFVYGVALPAEKTNYIKNWLSTYEEEEFEEFIKVINLAMPDDIGILAPANHLALSYSEKEIRSLIADVKNEDIKPYTPPKTPTSLLNPIEVEKLKKFGFENKGKGVSGAREIILANGVKLLLKSFKSSSSYYQNRIMLHGFIDKGAMAYPKEDYFSAVNAPLFIKNSGIKSFDKFALERYLTTTSLSSPNPYIENQGAGLKINAKFEDLEEMLQLTYLFFNEPAMSEEAYSDYKNRQEIRRRNQTTDLKSLDLNNNINKIIRDNSEVSKGTERYHGLENTEMTRGFEIYKELFTNAQDFTFIITGDFPIDSIIPTVNKYLGNLPSTKNPTLENSNAYQFSLPTGPVAVQFKLPETYSKINSLYRPLFILEKPDIGWREIITAEVLGHVLKNKIRGFRYRKGFAQYVTSAFSDYNAAKKRLEFRVSFDCTPEEYPMLRSEFHKVISELKSSLISEDFLGNSLIRLKEMYGPQGIKNTHRLIQEKLYTHYRFDVPWVDEKEVLPYINSITPEDILNAAQEYLRTDNLYEFAMMN